MIHELLSKFILQAKEGSLKTAEYPKELMDLKMKTSFGMGALARVPWMNFTAPEMVQVMAIFLSICFTENKIFSFFLTV